MRVPLLFLLLASALAPAAAPQSGGGFDQDWQAFDGGGKTVSGGGFSLVGSAGPATPLSGGSFAHDPGFVRGICGGTIETYGTGCPGTGGFVPVFTMAGCPSNGDDIVFDVQSALGGSFFSIYLGLGEGSLPIGGGCNLLTNPLLPGIISPLPLLGAGAGNGSLVLPVTVPSNVPSVVLPVTLQALVSDPGSPSGTGISASNGVKLTLN
ncbi:MAG: hypothetical protein ACF8XB_22370 [Planctomycetota bacterium JB042]